MRVMTVRSSILGGDRDRRPPSGAFGARIVRDAANALGEKLASCLHPRSGRALRSVRRHTCVREFNANLGPVLTIPGIWLPTAAAERAFDVAASAACAMGALLGNLLVLLPADDGAFRINGSRSTTVTAARVPTCSSVLRRAGRTVD